MIVLAIVLLLIWLLLGVGAALSNPDPGDAGHLRFGLTSRIGGLVLLGAAVGLVAMLALSLILRGAARKPAKSNPVQQVGRERETLAEENARLQAELERSGAHLPGDTGSSSASVAPPVAPVTSIATPGPKRPAGHRPLEVSARGLLGQGCPRAAPPGARHGSEVVWLKPCHADGRGTARQLGRTPPDFANDPSGRARTAAGEGRCLDPGDAHGPAARGHHPARRG
jgi:hypothetical protein